MIAYQYYDDYDEHRGILDRWSQLTAKPLYHADTCFSAPYTEMPPRSASTIKHGPNASEIVRHDRSLGPM